MGRDRFRSYYIPFAIQFSSKMLLVRFGHNFIDALDAQDEMAWLSSAASLRWIIDVNVKEDIKYIAS